MSVVGLIVAGGTGERFRAAEGKQLAAAAGRPLLAWTAAAFEACECVDAIVVVGHPDRLAAYAQAVAAGKLVAVVAGGETRQDSVAAGLAELHAGVDIVAVHDGARPLVTPAVISEAVAALRADPALDGVVVGHPMFDTVKRVDADAVISATVDRNDLWIAQTPQVFRVGTLRDAYERAEAEGFAGTDDASLVEWTGGRVRMLAGPRANIKVTVPGDLALVEAILAAREG